MLGGGRSCALASVAAVVVGFGFVWTTIEILRVVPELRLLVIWLLLLAASITTVAMVVFMYVYTRSGKKEQRAHDADALVSAVKRDRRIYPVD